MSEATSTITPSKHATFRVHTKAKWSDAWEILPYAEPIFAEINAGPSLSRAEIAFQYGDIKRFDRSSFSAADPLDIKGFFVRIEGVESNGNSHVFFYGFVPAEQLDIQSAHTAQASGTYKAKAVGLEYLLDDKRLYKSIVSDGNVVPVDVQIERTLIFNERIEYGLTPIGNRSTLKSGTPPDDEYYVFSEDGQLWSDRDIVEYTLFTLRPMGLQFKLDGQLEILDNLKPLRVDLQGFTARQILNQRIERRRGAGYVIRVNEALGQDDEITVHVFSTIGEDVTEGAITIPANLDQTFIAIDQNFNWDDNTLIVDKSAQYGWIVVLGALVRTVFSARYNEQTLEGIWTAPEKAGYDGATDEARATDKYRHVYTTHRIPRNMVWGPTSNPSVLNDGTIDSTVAAPIRQWGRRLLRQLPIVKDWSTTTGDPEYREPIAVVKIPGSSRYAYVDRLDAINLTPADVRMLDSEMGIEIMPAGLNHVFALNEFVGTTEIPAEVDYRELIVTAAMETDEHLKYVSEIEGTSEPDRVLTIAIPDAQLWWIQEGTVLDVDDTGNLEIQLGNAALRNDLDRLKGIAALARAWYGAKRATFSATYKGLLTSHTVGSYVTSVLTGNYNEQINSVITSMVFDFQNAETTIQTGYDELDFQAFGAA